MHDTYSLSDVLTAVLTGKFDTDLPRLKEAIVSRIQSVREKQAPSKYDLRPGQMVKFANHVHPEYLRGQTATVKEVRRVKVVLNLTNPYIGGGRFQGGIVSPVTSLELVE